MEMGYSSPMTAQKKTNTPASAAAPHYVGHRDRLKQRFLASENSLADYELLELLLTYAIPRRDVKPLAKELLTKYGTLAALCAAPHRTLMAEKGLGSSSALFLNLLAACGRHTAQTEAKRINVLANRLALIDYLYTHMGNLDREEFRVIYLDAKNHILADDVLFTGTINASAVYPREIIKKALSYGAIGMVLAHNHPSGDPTPSTKDEELTMHIQQLAAGLDITLHDHIIIGKDQHFSFLENGKL